MKINRFGSAALICTITAVSINIGPIAAHADSPRSKEWHLKTLRISEAHKISTGSGITVAVVDTGVARHPDLRENLIPGASFVDGRTGDGRTDPNGHGTEMAGLIASHGRTGGAGILGIAPEAKILPVQVEDASGRGGADLVAQGILFALQSHADVINASVGTSPSISINSALSTAIGEGALIIAAAGNEDDNLSSYPAVFPGVLAVGATNKDGKPAKFSSANANIQICAPGVDMESTSPPDKYANGQGTSQATAVVSGAAALIRAKFPELSADGVIHRITETATDIGAPKQCGAGIINIVKALTADVPPLGGTPASTTPASSPAAGPSSSGGGAAPRGESTGVNVVAIAGGVLGVLLVGGLVAFLVRRRRRGGSA